MPPLELRTTRLLVRFCTPELLRAELAGNAALGAALGARVAAEWPPGEHNLDAVRYFLETPGELRDGWANYYAITLPRPEAPATLVASIGYQGRPDGAGRVEIGYSVVASWRRRGIATEALGAMLADAAQRGLRSMVAHARPDNHASRAVLTKHRFRPSVSTREGQLGFERALYRVRRTTAAELPDVNRAYARISFEPSAPADLQLAADRAGELVGLGRIARLPVDTEDRSGVTLELGGVWVAPELRGGGVARALVRALLAAAGGRPLACLPFAHLQRFYASLGFVRWDAAQAPAALRRKLARCAATHPEPVVLMVRRG
ncbi:MAG: GNAT family N-acetyltransferase [Kofleriaceae bacterium]